MSHYRVRVKKGEIEVEVDSSDKDYTESKLKELLAGLEKPPGPKKGSGPATQQAEPRSSGKPISMVEYVRSLAPKSGTQYVVAVGDYLEKYGGMAAGFKTRDIADAFTTVKFKHSNPAEAVRQAKSQGLLMDGKEAGTFLVTSTGENWVRVQSDISTSD
jgi:hypothetical protein